MALFNKKKSFYSLIFLSLFISVFLTGTLLVGCHNKSNEKKITGQNETQLFNPVLSKVSEYGMARGWVDDNNILFFTSKLSTDNSDEYLNFAVHKWSQMKKLDTNNNNYTNIIGDRILRDASINNTNDKVAFIEELDDNQLQIVIKELSTGKETVVTSIAKRTLLNWSTNGKYLTFVKLDKLIIYDTTLSSMKEISLNGLEIRQEDTNFKISNDGKNALVKNRNLYLVQIPKGDLSSSYKTVIVDSNSNSENFAFYDNTKFLYTSASGELTGLYLYDLESSDKALIKDNVAGFSISPKGNNISFYQCANNLLYVGNFDGINIYDIYEVYKGDVNGNIWWNASCNKILFYSGSNYYIAKF